MNAAWVYCIRCLDNDKYFLKPSFLFMLHESFSRTYILKCSRKWNETLAFIVGVYVHFHRYIHSTFWDKLIPGICTELVIQQGKPEKSKRKLWSYALHMSILGKNVVVAINPCCAQLFAKRFEEEVCEMLARYLLNWTRDWVKLNMLDFYDYSRYVLALHLFAASALFRQVT